MQSSFCTVSSNSTNLCLSWASRSSKLPPPKTPEPVNSPKALLKPLTLSNSLKTSVEFQKDFDFREENQNLKNQEEEQPRTSCRLPIVVRNSGMILRYHSDGHGLKLASLNGNSISLWNFWIDFEDAVRKLARICGLLSEISSFQEAMFRAIGIGHKRSLPSAAALNWVLKDGLGRLSRCICTASLASAFDTNLTRVRFSTSVLFSLSIGVELLTPVFPSYFLLLASAANIAKQISLACYLATGTAAHRSFAVADNLGEVSAKTQIQTVYFDNLGLVLTAILNIGLRNNQRQLYLCGIPNLLSN